MKSCKDYIIRGLRLIYRVLSRKKFYPPECECDRQVANDMIYDLLSSDHPCMIARFGATEINCINNYLCVHSDKSTWQKWLDYITDDTHTPWWNKDQFHLMSIYSGIFPESQDIAERFSRQYLEDMQEIDMLACFQYLETKMSMHHSFAKVELEMLYPFYVDRPWTRILKGKRVLVIHPFDRTIRQQYARRACLFDNPDVLPDFELITLKAVQTVAGNKTEFGDWFEALRYMEDQIDAIDFDIALIGCGAYGLPLAAYIKRKGKKAVHIGGGLQLLFGILGRRWVECYPVETPLHYRPGIAINIDYSPLFNSNWIYPLRIDTPANAQAVEGACYW